MDLSGFSAFDFSEGVPYFSITQNGLTFNKAVVLKLGSPAFVRFLINEETHQVALQVCEESAPKAVAFKRLLANNFQEHGYRIDGELVENGLMLFSLNAAKPLV